MFTRLQSFRLATMLLFLLSAAIATADEPAPKPAVAEAPAAEQKLLPWHKRLAPAIDEARGRKTSILVRAGAEWCPWCRKLDEEIVKPDMQRELRGWVLVYLDIDENHLRRARPLHHVSRPRE